MSVGDDISSRLYGDHRRGPSEALRTRVHPQLESAPWSSTPTMSASRGNGRQTRAFGCLAGHSVNGRYAVANDIVMSSL